MKQMIAGRNDLYSPGDRTSILPRLFPKKDAHRYITFRPTHLSLSRPFTQSETFSLLSDLSISCHPPRMTLVACLSPALRACNFPAWTQLSLLTHLTIHCIIHLHFSIPPFIHLHPPFSRHLLPICNSLQFSHGASRESLFVAHLPLSQAFLPRPPQCS